jgi:hypothetical protein
MIKMHDLSEYRTLYDVIQHPPSGQAPTTSLRFNIALEIIT